MLKIRRLPEALKGAADAIEDLHKEMKRPLPPWARDQVTELRELTKNVLESQEYQNSKIRL
jgi:hypothetical protein